MLPKHRDIPQLLEGHFCSPIHLYQNPENTLLWGCRWIFFPQIQFENYCGRSFCLRQETSFSPYTEHNLTNTLPRVPLPSRLTAWAHICTASIHHFMASLGHKRLFMWKTNSGKSFVALCFQKSCNLAAENNRSLHSVLCQELHGQSEVLSVSADSSLVESFTQCLHLQSCTSLPDLGFLSKYSSSLTSCRRCTLMSLVLSVRVVFSMLIFISKHPRTDFIPNTTASTIYINFHS